METLVKQNRTGLARLFHLPSLSRQSALRVSRKRGDGLSSDDYTDYIEVLETCPDLKNAKNGLTLRQKISYFKTVQELQSNTNKLSKLAMYLFCEIHTSGYNDGEDLKDCLQLFCDYSCASSTSEEDNRRKTNLEPCIRSVMSIPLYSLSEEQKENCLTYLTRLLTPKDVVFSFLTRKTMYRPFALCNSSYIEVPEINSEFKNAKDGLTLRQKIRYFRAVEMIADTSLSFLDTFGEFANYLFCKIPTRGHSVGADVSDCLKTFCDYCNSGSELFGKERWKKEEISTKKKFMEPCVRSVMAIPLYSLNEEQKKECLEYLTQLRMSDDITFNLLTRKTLWNPIGTLFSFQNLMSEPINVIVTITISVTLVIGSLAIYTVISNPCMHSQPQQQTLSKQISK